MKRWWFSGLVLLTLIIGAIVMTSWREIVWSIKGRRIYWNGAPGVPIRGWDLRDGNLLDEGPIVRSYWLETGYLSQKADFGRWTSWHPSGVLKDQTIGGKIVRSAPPWLWGEADQTQPAIPDWMSDEVRWEAIIAEQNRMWEARDRRRLVR